MTRPTAAVRWLTAGDLNGFLALVIDNLSVLAFLVAALVGIFHFPADVIVTHMLPGTAFGVLVGDVAYTWMAKRQNRADATAMPLGVDAPTTIGMALLVLGPAFVAFKQQGMDEHAAAIATWQLGMAALVEMGVLKFVLSFFGAAVQRHVPRAGLLGSIAGIALVLMGFFPLVEILRVPLVGFAGLGIVLYALVANGPIPGRIPDVLFAVLVATLLYYVLGPAGLLGSGFQAPAAPQWHFDLPLPTLGFVDGLRATVPYLPLILPFGLLMVVGGINVTESARAAGDDYPVRDILLIEAIATLVAGLCGGVAQTTPYIGQPAYKAMGGRLGYTLLTGLFIGLGGVFGWLANLIDILPLAVLAPILIFVAINITMQAFEATPHKYFAAVVMAFFPPIARMLAIKLGDPGIVPPDRFAQLFSAGEHGVSELAVVVMLGNGFIITSMVWASFVVALIDQRPAKAAAILLLGAALTLFGVIHSVDPNGAMYLPWELAAAARALVWPFADAYVVLAAILLLLAALRPKTSPAGAVSHPN
jgi:AGZA family xanthine/uracil permease-like MFS transporter